MKSYRRAGTAAGVEKFIGDAVMAVFGVPALHEDDALRAVRAAVGDARRAAPSSALEGRIGVDDRRGRTGTDERLATGDAVNVAARLEQAGSRATPVGGLRRSISCGTAVDVEPIEPLVLKGKTRSRPRLPFAPRPRRTRAVASALVFVGPDREELGAPPRGSEPAHRRGNGAS